MCVCVCVLRSSAPPTFQPPSNPTHLGHNGASAADFPAHPIALPCPASRLPAPPTAATAGGAWEKDAAGKDHVLWDAEKRCWAASS